MRPRRSVTAFKAKAGPSMTATIELVDPPRWRELTPLFHDHNYRQLWDFGVACAERVNALSEHVAITDGDEILGLADVRIKRVPVLNAGIAYITGGPLVRRSKEGDPARLSTCLEALIDHYVHDRGLLLRIQPPLGTTEWNARQVQVFESAGFGPTDRVPRYRTLMLDIARPLEEIRKSLAQKWRNGLNRAEKNGLTVRAGHADELFGEFCSLYRRLLDRKGFEVDLDADFYARAQCSCSDGERFRVALADLDGVAVAGHVSSMLGDTCVYLLGASNEQGMQSKASYLLQWYTIRLVRERGCRWYDLGGIDPEANPGVHHFKAGIGGIDITAPGPFEIQPDAFGRRLVSVGETVYRAAKRVRSIGRL